MSGYTTQQIRPWVVNLAAYPVVVALFSGSAACPQGCRRFVARILHAKRPENIFRGELVDRLAGDATYEFGEYDVIDVGINESPPGRDHWGKTPDVFERLL